MELLDLKCREPRLKTFLFLISRNLLTFCYFNIPNIDYLPVHILLLVIKGLITFSLCTYIIIIITLIQEWNLGKSQQLIIPDILVQWHTFILPSFRTPSIRISTRQDVSKKTSETANNNRNSSDTPTGDGTNSTSSGSDPLKEFETEHIPEVPPDDHNQSQTNLDRVDAKWTGAENGPVVAEVGAASESANPGNESNMALSVLFILLLIALVLIPIAVVVQTNKEGIKSSTAYSGLATWFESVTGICIH